MSGGEKEGMSRGFMGLLFKVCFVQGVGLCPFLTFSVANTFWKKIVTAILIISIKKVFY